MTSGLPGEAGAVRSSRRIAGGILLSLAACLLVVAGLVDLAPAAGNAFADATHRQTTGHSFVLARNSVERVLSAVTAPTLGASLGLAEPQELLLGTEACCLPDGGCVDVPVGSPVCAELLGGVLMGPGTSCFTTSCDGACCFPETGACLEDLGWGDCVDLDGVFGGFGSDCEPVPCGLPRGTCCLPDGTCVDDVTENYCGLTLNGTWGGDGSACLDGVCCRGDVTLDGVVDFDDTLFLLARWGVCSPALSCDGDLNDDEMVGFDDLAVVLANFGCE